VEKNPGEPWDLKGDWAVGHVSRQAQDAIDWSQGAARIGPRDPDGGHGSGRDAGMLSFCSGTTRMATGRSSRVNEFKERRLISFSWPQPRRCSGSPDALEPPSPHSIERSGPTRLDVPNPFAGSPGADQPSYPNAARTPKEGLRKPACE